MKVYYVSEGYGELQLKLDTMIDEYTKTHGRKPTILEISEKELQELDFDLASSNTRKQELEKMTGLFVLIYPHDGGNK